MLLGADPLVGEVARLAELLVVTAAGRSRGGLLAALERRAVLGATCAPRSPTMGATGADRAPDRATAGAP